MQLSIIFTVSIFVDDNMLDDLKKTLSKRPAIRHDGLEISDFYDGQGYKNHSVFLSEPTNLSFLMNTDGVALFNSSKVSMWPIWLGINELPLSKRYGLV